MRNSIGAIDGKDYMIGSKNFSEKKSREYYKMALEE
jgi:hypothetical protein